MESNKKTKRGRSSELGKIPNVRKGGGSLNTCIKQMQKNDSYNEESDIEAEKVIGGMRETR